MDNSDTSSWLSTDNVLIGVQLHLVHECDGKTPDLSIPCKHPERKERGTEVRRCSLTNRSASRREEPHLQNDKHLCRRMNFRITAERIRNKSTASANREIEKEKARDDESSGRDEHPNLLVRGSCRVHSVDGGCRFPSTSKPVMMLTS